MPQKNNTLHTFEQAKEQIAVHVRAYRPSPAIARIEVKVKPIDQLGWLSAQKANVKVFGANQDDSAGIAGVGEAVRITGKGKVNFQKIFAQLRSHLTPQYPYLQWYGGFCFDAVRTDAAWSNFGSWRFVLPRFELARDKDKMIFACNLSGAIDKPKVLKELAALKMPSKDNALELNVVGREDHPTPQVWRKQVGVVLKAIAAGQSQKVVLARKTDLSFRSAPDPWAMLKSLKKVTPDSYHFAFGFGTSTFLGASPERLYKRHGRHILSEALAGTSPASSPAEGLQSSKKDRHEHQLVVDDIYQSLVPLCVKLACDRAPAVLSLSSGHHLNTKFQGQLKDGVQDEDILESLHPTPALGGLPKAFALNAIRHMEPFGRGWYAGPLGYVGLDWAEFVVGIRSGLVRARQLSVFAGAGIVEGSKPEDEWQEIENKIGNFIKIIK